MGHFRNFRRADIKPLTTSHRALHIRHLQRAGALQPGCISTGEWSRKGEEIISLHLRCQPHQLLLSYKLDRGQTSWQTEEFPIALEWTPCNYGGSRPWFRCPEKRCGSRVAILYAGASWACRHCFQLAYPSQRLAPHARALRRARRIRIKLGGSPGMIQPFPSKPKGMHWRTYRRLHAEADLASRQSWPRWALQLMLRAARTHPARNSDPILAGKMRRAHPALR